MKIEELKNECTGCTACAFVCPKQCIDIKLDTEGFYFPVIDKDRCISCKKCETICHCLNQKEAVVNKTSYYGFSSDKKIRSESSSGGAFSSLAQSILNTDGNVYGAAFDYTDLFLKHTCTDECSLKNLRKSKYVESFLGNTFSKIQNDLNRGRKVLFCGTPCQVSGLKQIVKDENNLLLTVDFICHGVPSGKLLKEHLQHLHKKEKVLEIDFRSKDHGWSGENIVWLSRTENSKRTLSYRFDPFYFGFMTCNAFLRRSCYKCRSREKHYSEITIADFWGWRELDAQLNDEKGLSLIIANNEVGKKFVEDMPNFELHKIDNKFSAYAYQNRDYSSAWILREKFFNTEASKGFEKAAQKTYMRGKRIEFLKYKLKQLLKI